jgi:aryl-alcohol dehydrogenase-like predicted oxidoreductase
MNHRAIGPLSVSEIGLGCNQFGTVFDEAHSARVVQAAYDMGVTLFDTADEYGESERYIGRALKKVRDKVVIVTKFGSRNILNTSGELRARPADEGGASARWIVLAVERSLRRLETDYIDLYQLHFPDDATPIAETMRALENLVRDGKVRQIGCCNFSGVQIDAANEAGGVKFISAQNRLNLLRQEALADVVPTSRRHGMALLPYFPLASGMLTGKYKAGEKPPKGTRLGDTVAADMAARALNEKTMTRIAALDAFAKARGRSLHELAIAWLLAQAGLASVIAGARSAEQVKANIAAAAWQLNADEATEASAIGQKQS